jgi:antitoxin component YwqK of YwqJK toxin-antitoxin module
MWSFSYIIERLYSFVLSIFSSTHRSNKVTEGRKESDDRVVEKKESKVSEPNKSTHIKFLYFVVGIPLIVITYALFDSDKVVNHIQNRNGVIYEVNSETPFRGKLVMYHDNGQKELDTNYKNGWMYGEYTHWYKNGQKSEQGTFGKDGTPEGLVTRWYENGKKRREEKWEDGDVIWVKNFKR